jgi:hypothetical protein
MKALFSSQEVSQNVQLLKSDHEVSFLSDGAVGISHEAVLLQETAKPALFRATTNILSSDQ